MEPYPLLSLVIPAFNEEQCLSEVVGHLHNLLTERLEGTFEIILVNDGSRDQTLARMESLVMNLPSVCLLSYEHNQGKGYALTQGLKMARGDLMAFVDADGEIAPEQLFLLLEKQSHTRAGAVVGIKRVKGPRVWSRYLASGVARGLARSLFKIPLSDTQTGLKLFSRSEVQPLLDHCRERGFLFDLELLYLARRRRIRLLEVPVEVHILRANRLKLWTVFRSGAELLRLRWRLWFNEAPHNEGEGRLNSALPSRCTLEVSSRDD